MKKRRKEKEEEEATRICMVIFYFYFIWNNKEKGIYTGLIVTEKEWKLCMLWYVVVVGGDCRETEDYAWGGVEVRDREKKKREREVYVKRNTLYHV